MPLNDYKCDCGHTFEKFVPLSKFDEKVLCPECMFEAKRLITLGHGGAHGEEAAWINESNVAITSKHEKPVTTRKEWKQRLKDKGLSPVG